MSGFATYRASDVALRVDAIEDGIPVRADAKSARLGQALRLDTQGLEAFFFARWDPRLYDLLVVAAVVEFCDRVKRRPAHGWARTFDVRVAVHDEALWRSAEVSEALQNALSFLTGDVWRFRFEPRKRPEPEPRQVTLPLPAAGAMIMPYSEGLDSLAVHALTLAAEQSDLVRVRLGSGGVDSKALDKDRQPFARVPYRVAPPESPESSARSRGFKFAVVTAIAAAMSGVSRIVVTESG